MKYLISSPDTLKSFLHSKTHKTSDRIIIFGNWTNEDRFLNLLREKDYQIISLNNFVINENFNQDVERLYVELISLFKKIYEKNNFSTSNIEYLIGPYIQVISSVLISRINDANQIDFKNIDFFVTEKLNYEEIISLDFQEFIYKVFNHKINNFIYSEIFKKKIKLKYISSKKNYFENSKNYNKKLKNFLKIKKKFIFIHEIGLNNILENLLKLITLSFIPKYYKIPYKQINDYKNRKNKFRITASDFKIKKSFIYKIIKYVTPLSYIENYKYYQKEVVKHFPQHVKYLFCSSSYFFDDFFKHWLKLLNWQHSKLIILQHGGVYGMYKYKSLVEKIENKIANIRFTWGWEENKKTIKFMCLKFFFKRFIKKKRDNKNILILCCKHKYYSRGEPWDTYLWQNRYLKILKQISYKLNNVKNYNLIFRLHPAASANEIGLDIKKFLLKKNKKISDKNFDNKKTMYESLKSSKLVVATINSTGLLESILSNMPTAFLYWDYEINPPSLIFEEQISDLIKVKIIHTKVSSLLSFIRETNIDNWWNSEEVKKVKKCFLKNYANNTFENSKNFLKIFDKYA